MKKLIGLSGVARSGKDTAAARLVDAHGFTRIAFADPMRGALLALNPLVLITPDESECAGGLIGVARLATLVGRVGWEDAKKCGEVRTLLQRFGTEAGRDVHGANCWVDIGMRNALTHDRVVVSDVRFPNEAKAILRYGGKVVRIVRPGYGPVNGHSSDQGLPDDLVDAEIANDGTVADLYRKIDEIAGV